MRSVVSGAVFTLTAPILGMSLNASGGQLNGGSVHEGGEVRAPAGGERSAAASPLKPSNVPNVVEDTLILVNDE